MFVPCPAWSRPAFADIVNRHDAARNYVGEEAMEIGENIFKLMRTIDEEEADWFAPGLRYLRRLALKRADISGDSTLLDVGAEISEETIGPMEITAIHRERVDTVQVLCCSETGHAEGARRSTLVTANLHDVGAIPQRESRPEEPVFLRGRDEESFDLIDSRPVGPKRSLGNTHTTIGGHKH